MACAPFRRRRGSYDPVLVVAGFACKATPWHALPRLARLLQAYIDSDLAYTYNEAVLRPCLIVADGLHPFWSPHSDYLYCSDVSISSMFAALYPWCSSDTCFMA